MPGSCDLGCKDTYMYSGMAAIYFKYGRLKLALIFTALTFVSFVVFRSASNYSFFGPSVWFDTSRTANISIRKVCIGNEYICSRLDTVLNNALSRKHWRRRVKDIPPLFDFKNQPCVDKITPSPDLVANGECVRTVMRSKAVLDADTRECVNLSVANVDTPICIHNTTMDKYISVYLKESGNWEPLLTFNIYRLTLQTKRSMFLDLGCNVGAFTLAAAKAGANVVAVDPLLDNLDALSKSLHIGNLSDKVTLVWNAVTSERTTVTLQKYPGNVGGTAIKFDPTLFDNVRESVNTIKLDDLQEFFLGKPTFIKMDVETQELETLLSGELFFQTVDVRVVLLEYNWHKDKASGIQIFTFMDERGFRPYNDARGHLPLLIEERRRWPGEVFFLKQEYFQDFLQNV